MAYGLIKEHQALLYKGHQTRPELYSSLKGLIATLTLFRIKQQRSSQLALPTIAGLWRAGSVRYEQKFKELGKLACVCGVFSRGSRGHI